MRAWAAFVLASGLAAQQAPPADTVHGILLEFDQAASGQLTVRARDNYVHCFAFDSRTEVVRGGERIPVAQLRRGDTLELLAQAGSTTIRYARLVRVLARRPVVAAAPPPRWPWVYRRPYTYNPLDDLYPRGNLTLSGIVSRLDDGRLVLRTRSRGATSVLLREDTRYVQDGQQVARSRLRINDRVFVRGSRNLEDEIEAYSVMWGEILKPE